MLLSRFWYLVLAVAAGASLSMAMLSTGMFNREYTVRVEENLSRDRLEIESLLKIDARARIDAIAPIAADGDVREGLRGAARGKSSGVKKRLRSLNKQLAGLKADLLILVDSRGEIVAQVGRKRPKAGAGLGAVPVVAAALGGYMADDTWIYNGSVYRVAARPVVDSGRYAGAIVHAQLFDAQLAQILSERLGGATVGFFLHNRMIASYAPTDLAGAPTHNEVESKLKLALADEHFSKGERSAPFDLEGRSRAVYSLVAGSASNAEVGYVIARPYTTLASPFAVFERTTADDVQGLPKLPVALAVLFAFAVGLGSMWVERDRPIRQFRQDLEKIIAGQAEEVDIGVQRGAYRRLAEAVNESIEKSVKRRGGKGPSHKADLDELLGPAEASTSSAFSFGGAEEEPVPEAQPMAMPAPQAMPAPKPSAPKAQAAAPKPKTPAPASRALAAAPPTPQALRSSSSELGFEDDDATIVAESIDKPRPTIEEAHFREVFDSYLTMKKRCGEPVEGLNFEKFAGTLRKNRDQILSKHTAKEVRFTVYEKGGKAALKATPVRA